MGQKIKEIYKYREFLKTSIKKEVRGKYKASFLGVLWSFLNPLLTCLVYAIIFPLILKNQQPNYVVFLITALLPWTFFTTSLNQSASVMLQNGNIIKKVYFPREILPITIVTSNLVNFLISVIIIALALIISGIGFSMYNLLFIPITIIEYVLCLGFANLLSAFTVYLRDIEHFIGIIISILFYGTPIAYSLTALPAQYQKILLLNPMTTIIESFRDCLLYKQMPNMYHLGLVALFSFALFLVSTLVFSKLEKNFAENL